MTPPGSPGTVATENGPFRVIGFAREHINFNAFFNQRAHNFIDAKAFGPEVLAYYKYAHLIFLPLKDAQ